MATVGVMCMSVVAVVKDSNDYLANKTKAVSGAEYLIRSCCFKKFVKSPQPANVPLVDHSQGRILNILFKGREDMVIGVYPRIHDHQCLSNIW